MLTITGINLTDDVEQEQLSLFGDDPIKKERTEKVEFTMDAVRQKFGTDSIGFASVMSNDLGIRIRSDESNSTEGKNNNSLE